MSNESKTEVAAERMRLRTAGWPSCLTKSADTPGEYVCFVDDLGVIRFEGAKDVGEGWVHISPRADGAFAGDRLGLPFAFPLGVDVRLSSVLWVAEVPES